MATDADRVNMLPGMIGQAAKSKMSRASKLEDAENESLGKDTKKEEVAEQPATSADKAKKASLTSRLLRMIGR